jgi:hypothetical protein
MVLLEPERVFHEDNGAELAEVVFNIESVLATLDDRVDARDGDVVDPDFALVTSAQLELLLLRGNCEHVNVARSVFVERHGLQQDELALLLCDVNELEQIVVPFENVGVTCSADFAFKLLPVITGHVLAKFLHMSLRLDPTLQALKVDQPHGAATLACQDQRVLVRVLGAPAEAAIHVALLVPTGYGQLT